MRATASATAAGRTTTALSTAGPKPAATADTAATTTRITVSYGSWQSTGDSQHRRTKTCSTCGYSTYEVCQPQLSPSARGQTTATRSTGALSPAPAVTRPTSTPTTPTRTATAKCDGCSKELTVYVDVTLDACGGVLADDEVTVVFGDTYGELPEPTREGYTFDGWYTEKDWRRAGRGRHGGQRQDRAHPLCPLDAH